MLEALFLVWVLFGCLMPVLVLLGTVQLLRTTPWLRDQSIEGRSEWPRLSVIIPACNEADTLEPALRSLLAQDYPGMELVLIDDRSTDGTPALVDRLAALDPRITALHIERLPEGWLGKVHAMARGVERSSGEWIVFTDADVHFAPGALRRAVAHALQRRLGHLSIFPEIPCTGLLLGAALSCAFRSIMVLTQPWRASDPRSDKAMGVGAFNMVSRAALAATPGLEWLRMEVADDVALGVMMKRAGTPAGLALGRGQLQVEWYPTAHAFVRGLEKNGFAQAARFSVLRAAALGAMCLLLPLGPYLAFWPGERWWLPIAGVVAWLAFAAHAVLVAKVAGAKLHYVLLSLPLGDWMMGYTIVRATWLGVRRGGLVWRGTSYSVAALRAGQRIKF